MSLKTKDVHSIFNKLEMDIRDSKDKLAFFVYKGRQVLVTKVPHKKGDVKGNVPHLIRQQLKLNETDFGLLKQCPLTREGYIEILRKKGIIDWDC